MQTKSILAKTAVVISLCALCSSVFAAPTSKSLTKSEELYPQGWTVGDQIKFKKGTTASLNDNGAVISGVLASDTYLRPQGWQRIINDYYFVSAYTNRSPFFPRYYRYWNNNSTYNIALSSYGHISYKGGTAVTFSEQGTVLNGTIADETTVGLGSEKYGFIAFKSGTILDFYNDGAVKKGTLAEDTKLRPVGWQNNAVDMENAGFVEFKGKSIVSFTPDGEVTNCTIKEPLKWKDNGVEIELPGGSIINFTEQGAAIVKE